MTPYVKVKPLAGRWLRLGLLVLLAVLLLVPSVARAGADDFEFGKRLAAARFFDYAKKVFEGILANPNASDEDKGEAKYGLALLKKEEALAAAGRGDVTYADIVKLFDSAANDVQDFVKQNPKNKNAVQARLDVGTIRLAFVQWARELLQDAGEMKEREIQPSALEDDAKRMVAQAIEYFDGLRPPPNKYDPTPLEELASYYYVISQYYRALVEPPCSPAAMAAFEKAGNDLDIYILDHDGQLLAVYAQDIYGLVWWERAKCEQDVEKKETYYNKAFEWFETCIYTEDQGADYLRVITSGYYHIAQAGLDAGRTPNRNFARDALSHLESMLEHHPSAWRTENGLRAIVEQSKLECQRGNANRAVEVARDAAEKAKAAGMPALERLANRQLNVYVSGGCGGSIGGLDPEVLKRVADDLFLRGQWDEAIRAYRTVINSTSPTTDDFLAYRWDAWEKMASAYGRQGDQMGEILALEPIHDAWLRGDIPHVKGKEDDPNMLKAASSRKKALRGMAELAQKTGSAVLRKESQDMQASYPTDYPDDKGGEELIYRTALTKWKEAQDQKDKNDARWRKTLQESREKWRQLVTNPKIEQSDMAWVYLVRCEIEESKFAEAVKVADEAFAAWDKPDRKAEEEKFPTVRVRRDAARYEVTFWKARAQHELGQSKEVLATLADFHTTWPDARYPYPEMAYDIMTQAYIQLGEIEKGDRTYRALLRRDPKYFNLARLTFLLADHYNQQRAAIDEQLIGVKKDLNEKRKLFRQADKEAFRLSALLADLKLRKAKAEELLRAYEKQQADPKLRDQGTLTEGDAREARETIKELDEKQLPEVTAALAEWAPKRDALQSEITTLQDRQREMEQQIYEPLVKSADYYREWDEALQQAEQPRDPANVAIFAQMFWNAGRLRPEVLENWQKARKLYESYFSFPKIKDLPITDPDKRSAISRLGDVYVNLAENEKDPVEQRKLVLLAVDLLQKSLAEKAADNDLVVGMLSDKVLVLSWRDPRSGGRVRFAIPRPATIRELRDGVRDLSSEDNPHRPSFANEMEKREWEQALLLFRRDLDSRDDNEVKRWVPDAGKSLFDPQLYKDLANYQPDFRLALAWSYSHTGRDEDVPKALNLALSLVQGLLAVEDDTPEWWQARAIQMHIYLEAAARRLQGEGASASDAAQWLQTAGQVFTGLAASSPDLGESVIPGNRAKWMQTLQRLNELRGRAGLSAVDAPPPPSGN